MTSDINISLIIEHSVKKRSKTLKDDLTKDEFKDFYINPSQGQYQGIILCASFLFSKDVNDFIMIIKSGICIEIFLESLKYYDLKMFSDCNIDSKLMIERHILVREKSYKLYFLNEEIYLGFSKCLSWFKL
jgi:hypothetical protein